MQACSSCTSFFTEIFLEEFCSTCNFAYIVFFGGGIKSKALKKCGVLVIRIDNLYNLDSVNETMAPFTIQKYTLQSSVGALFLTFLYSSSLTSH